MGVDQVVDLAREMLMVILKASAPMLLVSLVVGLLISIFQTVTSIQEQTLTFVPKLIAIFLVLILCGGWIMSITTDFMVTLCRSFSEFIRYS